MKPREIEDRSFEIISNTIKGLEYDDNSINILKRVIHTTADFDYVENLTISEDAVSTFKKLVQNDVTIVTDTKMSLAGINKGAISKTKVKLVTFISNEQVAKNAKKNQTTRSKEAVKFALENIETPIIFVVGNAPTALMEICELIDRNEYKDGLVIAVPVGFVNVIESKEMIMKKSIPYIVSKGRKGGSNVAAAIINALLYDYVGRENEK
ncbi:MAG: precorrin-8X methylmutase [Bacilli bacterium]